MPTAVEPVRAVALLRAVNVGGRNKLAMAELRATVESLGHTDVSTYIQSGNLVMTTVIEPVLLEVQLAEAIARHHGIDIAVMVRTASQLSEVLRADPFAPDVAGDAGECGDLDGARRVVVFLSAVPEPEAVATLDSARFAPDRFQVTGREMYVHFPNGIGRSKFTTDHFERRLGVSGTARNINTIRKLLVLADA